MMPSGHIAAIIAAVCLAAPFSFGASASQPGPSSSDIEINDMSTDLGCSDLDVSYSQSRGEIYVRFNDPLYHSSGDMGKTHCLVDFDVYVPEGYRFATRNLALLGHVYTDDDTRALVATSFRSIGKAGPVVSRRFGSGEDRLFYIESRRSAPAAANSTNCDGFSMKLRLRVDLSMNDGRAQVPIATDTKKLSPYLKVDSAALRYKLNRCR